MKDVNEFVQTVFSGLSPLVIEDVADEGERTIVRARTPQDTAACPVCGISSGRVHGYHWRTVADVPVDGRRVVVRVRDRYQRRTTRLTRQVMAVVKELAGRAGARLLAIPAVGLKFPLDLGQRVVTLRGRALVAAVSVSRVG